MVLILLLSYLIGSIPFGLIITRCAGLPDIRNIGSGNIGATNVLRTGKKHLAACTLALDMVKGMLPVLLAKSMGLPPELVYLTALAAVIGHIFPVWLKFKGGKGVATALGTFLGISFIFGLVVIAIWLIAYQIKHYASVSAIAAFSCAPVVCYFLQPGLLLALIIATIGSLVIYRHKSNIQNLLSGTEPRVGDKL